MAVRIDDVDFTGICQCMPPIPDPSCKQGSQTYEHVVRIVVRLPPYLNRGDTDGTEDRRVSSELQHNGILIMLFLMYEPFYIME